MRRLAGGIVVALLSIASVHAFAKPPPKALPKPAAPAPDAARVVVRNSTTLRRAVRAAYDRATDLAEGSAVLLVFDAGDGTAAAQSDLVDAVRALSDAPNHPGAWLAAPLGGFFAPPVRTSKDLAPWIEAALVGKTDPSRDGVGLLRKTLETAPQKPGLVLYFAHAHLEDDGNLESLISDLIAAKRTLCVIGPEAAFECSWGDMFSDRLRDKERKNGALDYSVDGVGRSPFGPADPTAPWRGGDTAYPMVPYEFGPSADWKVRLSLLDANLAPYPRYVPDPRVDPDGFDEWARTRLVLPDRKSDGAAYRAWLAKVGTQPNSYKDPGGYERWLVALVASAPAAPPPTAGTVPAPCRTWDLVNPFDDWATKPVPSSFGPYGWMRASGATGGAYVLWGWVRGPSAPYRYDYTKCNALPPDLHSRGEVFADAMRRPLAAALLSAWTALAQSPGDVMARTPPIVERQPAAMEKQFGVGFSPAFATPEKRDEVVADVAECVKRLDRVRASIEKAVDAVKTPKDDVDRRLQADAELFLHALDTVRFHVSEFGACAAGLPPSAWKIEKDRAVVIERVDWICSGPDDAPPGAPHVAAHDPVAGAKIAAARKAFLERYKGTPMGAIVARNPVSTYRPSVLLEPPAPELGHRRPAGNQPPPDGATTPPTGGSTGTGPTTGR